jgi:hypothetical protein
VGVSPLGGVQRPDVVATHEADVPVDHEDLAVVAAGLPHVEQKQTESQGRIADDVDGGREVEEAARHHQVGEPVVDDVHVDATLGRLDQRLLELVPEAVVLDDVGLEEHPPSRATDGREHVSVQVLAERVDRRARVAHVDVDRFDAREPVGPWAHSLAPRVDAHQSRDHAELGDHHPEQTTTDPVPHPTTPSRHGDQPRLAPTRSPMK